MYGNWRIRRTEDEIGEAWACPKCGLMVTEGHECQVRDAKKCEFCGLMVEVGNDQHKCPKMWEQIKAERKERRKQAAIEKRKQHIKPVVKMIKPKKEMTFMEPMGSLESIHYEPVKVVKNPWECLSCGLIWQTEHEARDCEARKHVSSYTKTYGVWYVENGKAMGNPHKIRFSAIRRDESIPLPPGVESSPVGESDAPEDRFLEQELAEEDSKFRATTDDMGDQ